MMRTLTSANTTDQLINESLIKLRKIQNDIETGISMFEAAKMNYLAENRCPEYNPWSYNLVDNSFFHNKPCLNEKDELEIQNSVVHDLVAKVLDNNNNTNEAIHLSQNFNQRNDNQRIENYNFQHPMKPTQRLDHQSDVISSLAVNSETLNAHAINSNDYFTAIGISQESKNVNNRLNDLSPISCLPHVRPDVEKVSNQNYVNHIERSLDQIGANQGQSILSNTTNSFVNQMPSLNQVHCLPLPNWQERGFESGSNGGLYLQSQNDKIDFNNGFLRNNRMNQSITQSYNSNTLFNNNVHGYNVITNRYNSYPDSVITDSSEDSDFLLSNSPPQFIPLNHSNIQLNKYEECNKMSSYIDYPKSNSDKSNVLNNFENLSLQKEINSNILQAMPSRIQNYKPVENISHTKFHEGSKGLFNNNHNVQFIKTNYPQQYTSHSISNIRRITNRHKHQTSKHSSINSDGPVTAQKIDNNAYHQLLYLQEQHRRLKNAPEIQSGNSANFFSNKPFNQTPLNTNNNSALSVDSMPGSLSLIRSMGLNNRFYNGDPTKHSVPSKDLYIKIEQACNQFKLLETERKKYETELEEQFPDKEISSISNIPIPKIQVNPSKVDRLIVDHFREHARVITLIAQMELLRNKPMNKEIHKSIKNWLESIKYVQECRKQEANVKHRPKSSIPSLQEDEDILTLVNGIRDLAQACRYARTAMYNAMQTILLHDSDIEEKVEHFQDPVIELITKEDEDKNENENEVVASNI